MFLLCRVFQVKMNVVWVAQVNAELEAMMRIRVSPYRQLHKNEVPGEWPARMEMRRR